MHSSLLVPGVVKTSLWNRARELWWGMKIKSEHASVNRVKLPGSLSVGCLAKALPMPQSLRVPKTGWKSTLVLRLSSTPPNLQEHRCLVQPWSLLTSWDSCYRHQHPQPGVEADRRSPPFWRDTSIANQFHLLWKAFSAKLVWWARSQNAWWIGPWRQCCRKNI